MPIYEYKCLRCDSRFEKMQKVSEPPFEVCEKCGGELEKQWSLSGFQFKGAGWYVTDYAGKGKETAQEKSVGGEKSEKSENVEKSEKSEKAEKTSPTESTAKTESASKQGNDGANDSKKESVVKKD